MSPDNYQVKLLPPDMFDGTVCVCVCLSICPSVCPYRDVAKHL